MFGLGVGEIFLVLLVMIIFIQPEDFPSIVRYVGKLYGQMMQIYYTFMDEIQNFEDRHN